MIPAGLADPAGIVIIGGCNASLPARGNRTAKSAEYTERRGIGCASHRGGFYGYENTLDR